MEVSPMYYPQSQAQPQLQYAGVGMRFLALLIDGVLMSIVYGIIIVLFLLKPAQGADLVGFYITLAYFIGLEATRGATLGKMALGLCVVKTDGSPIGWSESFTRNLLLVIDCLFGCLVGAILIWTSPQRQRLGDRIAHTVVIYRQS
jgi:uncharacterized RDD family membrane protein YckC